MKRQIARPSAGGLATLFGGCKAGASQTYGAMAVEWLTRHLKA